jgi:hypothetical protein
MLVVTELSKAHRYAPFSNRSHVTMFVPESLYNISSMRSLLTARESQLYAAEGTKVASPMAYSAAEQKIQLYSPVRILRWVYSGVGLMDS